MTEESGNRRSQSLAVAGLPITQYIYDAEGARIGKGTLCAAPPNSTSLCAPPLSSGFTLTARYLVDLGGNQVTELSEQSGEVWKHSNVFSAARLTATYDTSGLHYELADPLGTKRVQANISGQIEMSWASLPFGDALTPIPPPNPPPTADDATEHHFTQKERDNESGNDYFFARYYNSAMGRFTTPDWSAKVVPVPYAQMGDPQSLNLYAYVRNNPIAHVDPDGHACNPNDWGCNPWSANSAQSEARRAAQGWPQQQTQQQNAGGASSSNQGTPFKPINLPGSNTTVSGTFDKYYGVGGALRATIIANPSNCDDCRWIQLVISSRTSPFIDVPGGRWGGNPTPLYPLEGGPANQLNDRPYTYKSIRWTAVSVVGDTNIYNRTFTMRGAITWGYTIDRGGNLTISGPFRASAAQQMETIQEATRWWPTWTIK